MSSSVVSVSRETVQSWAVIAARAADEKNGLDTLVLDVADVLSITDFFVVTSASNTRLVRAIADEIELKLREADAGKPLRIEGMDEGTWVLLDYGDLVIHIFDDEERSFYEIERLYRDVPVIVWNA
jgi:ribosome-associated protein